jgi:hypothetical protein
VHLFVLFLLATEFFLILTLKNNFLLFETSRLVLFFHRCSLIKVVIKRNIVLIWKRTEAFNMNMSETPLSYMLVVLSKTTFCRLKVFNIFFKLMSSGNGPTNLNPCRALRHFNSTVGQIKIKHFKYCIFFKYSIGISFLNIFIICYVLIRYIFSCSPRWGMHLSLGGNH